MKRLCVGDQAPDFTLPNHEGSAFKLSEILSSQNVMLVFNLGFI